MGTWNDQTTLNLIKHWNDHSRVRNKLSFDLMEKIPNLTSLRTQFVHLYVKDMTVNSFNETYEDYGLYTHIEQPNKRFLKAHLLDPNGYLYKANFFEFERYPNQLKLIDDPEYNEEQFELIFEAKGRKDHTKLLAMLDDVNNTQIPIEEIMDKHFDLDNFLTWTAVNILMDNTDANSSNFYLYSPLNSEMWYFLPWDYDDGWELQRINNSIHPYQAGISQYWVSVLHKRYFQTEKHVNQLTAKLKELEGIVNSKEVEKQLSLYQPNVKPLISRNPDIKFLPIKIEDYDAALKQFQEVPSRSMERYIKDLEKPKPFYMFEPLVEETQLVFNWQLSFDLQNDDLFYDVDVAKDPLFKQVIHTESGVLNNQIVIKRPPNGYYYWRVTARDSQGNTQTSFDVFTDTEEVSYYGVLRLEVQ